MISVVCIAFAMLSTSTSAQETTESKVPPSAVESAGPSGLGDPKPVRVESVPVPDRSAEIANLKAQNELYRVQTRAAAKVITSLQEKATTVAEDPFCSRACQAKHVVERCSVKSRILETPDSWPKAWADFGEYLDKECPQVRKADAPPGQMSKRPRVIPDQDTPTTLRVAREGDRYDYSQVRRVRVPRQ